MTCHMPRSILSVFLALAGTLVAAEAPPAASKAPAKPAGKAKPQEPVHVWAEKIRYVRAESLVRITGDATIIKKDLRIDATEVLAYLDEQSQFKRIVATGNVRIHSVPPVKKRTVERPPLAPKPAPEYRKALCHTADYDLKKNVVLLLGNPKEPDVQPIVWINKDEVHADKILFDQNTNLTTFEGRVKLSALTPKGEGSAPGLTLPGPN